MVQIVRLKELGYPGEINDLVEDALEWIESEYGLVYDIALDRTTAPKYAFEIYEYEDFGNYTHITSDQWFLYRTRKEATYECLTAMINYIQNENSNDRN